MDDEFDNMQKAIYVAIANTECKEPLNAIMALCSTMCDLLVQTKMDDERYVVDSVIRTLRVTKEMRGNMEIH
jgi:hypothetical protein